MSEDDAKRWAEDAEFYDRSGGETVKTLTITEAATQRAMDILFPSDDSVYTKIKPSPLPSGVRNYVHPDHEEIATIVKMNEAWLGDKPVTACGGLIPTDPHGQRGFIKTVPGPTKIYVACTEEMATDAELAAMGFGRLKGCARVEKPIDIMAETRKMLEE